MSFVVRNDLDRFLGKLKNYKAQDDLADKVLDKLLDKGEKIARTLYNLDNDKEKHSVSVSTNKTDNKGQIVASGKAVPYLEFGTGIVGKGTYEGELPQSGVPITGHWEYDYDSPHKVDTPTGRGWYYGDTFTQGRVAGMQMFNTAKELREYIKTDLAKDIKES